MANVVGPVPETFRAVENLLGGRSVLRARSHSTLDWIKVIRRGIPAAAVESLTKAMKLSHRLIKTGRPQRIMTDPRLLKT